MANKLTSGELRALLYTASAVSEDVALRLPAAGGQELGDLFESLANGRWEDVLRSPSVLQAIVGASASTAPSDDQALLDATTAAVHEAAAGEDSTRVRVLLAAGAAALSIFTQANFTGPLQSGAPSSPARLLSAASGAASGDETADEADAADRSAAKLLQVDGEELVGRLAVPGYLLLARAALLDPLGLKCSSSSPETPLPTDETSPGAPVMDLQPPCASWGPWALRALSTHQRVVAKRSATLRAHQGALDPVVAATWGTLPWAAAKVEEALGPAASAGEGGEEQGWAWVAPLLAGVCRMELGALSDQYGDMEQAAVHLEAAGCALGMDLELTGIMGKRTVHQEDDKAQMVAKVHRTGTLAGVSAMERRSAEEQCQKQSGAEAADGPAPGHISSGWKESEDIDDVMDMPKLEASDSSLGLEDLTSAEQALLLRAAIHDKKREAGDETVKLWKMVPFVEAVLRQPQATPSITAAAHLMRSRHEASRTRTKQRAFLRFTDLVEGMMKAPSGQSRLCMVYATPLPALPSVRKEYAEMMISIGLVGEAMSVFEKLELWNSLITCYTMMDKKAQATELIKKRLEVYPDDASLLCSLGDCTGDEQMYHSAWEKSGKRSARAMRSLADSAHRKKEYGKAAEFWEAALALNPLHSSGWFSLGHCYIQQEEHDKAIRAFTRCCQLEPDNGASWNNIAAVCLSQKKYKEAFSALAESSKYLRQNWHTWDNYVQVALIIGEHSAAVTGLQHMIHIRQGKDVPMEALSQLAEHFEGLEDEQQLLYSRFGEVLKSMARLGCSDARFWSAFARFHAVAGHKAAQKECLIKCTRAMAGTPWQKDEGKYEQLVDATIRLAKVVLGSVCSGEAGRKDLSQVRMQMRGVAKQAEECFDEQQSYKMLLQTLDKVVQEEDRLKEAESDACGATDDGMNARTAGAGIRNIRS